MRNHKRRAVLGNPVEFVLNVSFSVAVERGGGFIEQQDRRSLEYGASDGDTLLFAAGKLQTAFANLGIIAFRCAANESIDLSLARRFLDFGVARIPAPVADVVADRVVKQNRVLRHHANRGAQGGLGNLADILVVNQDATTGNIIKTKQ